MHFSWVQAERGKVAPEGGSCIHLRKQLDLEVRPLGTVFLHKIGVRNGFFHFDSETESLSRGGLCESQCTDCRPRGIDVLTQSCLRVRCRISSDYIESACQKLRRPAGTDDPGADDGDTSYGFVRCHISFAPRAQMRFNLRSAPFG